MPYETPLTYQQIVEKYGQEKADELKSNPAHEYRMTTGIELVHPEPSRDEQMRIWSNWLQMSSDQKDESNVKSMQLFNMTNKDHHYKLMEEKWKDEIPFRDKFIQLVNRDSGLTADDFLRFRAVIDITHPNGTFEVKPNENNFKTKILVKKGEILNIKDEIHTTIGRLLVNRIVKIDPFGAMYEFEDKPLKINKFLETATADLILGKVTEEQVRKLIDNAIWLGRFCDMAVPSLSRKIMSTPKKVKELRAQLHVKHKEEIANGDISYVDNVETPVINALTEELKDDPSWLIFNSCGKPNVQNHIKQTIGTFSPIMDPATGKYNIPQSCLEEGHRVEFWDSMANMNINGSYAKAVGTQNGGAIVKSIYNSMNHLKCAEKGTDCETTHYKRVTITDANRDLYVWNYAVVGGNLVLLTPDVIKTYIGKTLNMRSILFCGYKKKFQLCNKCVGELPYRIGLLHLGNLTARVGDTFLQDSLKGFHETRVKLTSLDVFKYMSVV